MVPVPPTIHSWATLTRARGLRSIDVMPPPNLLHRLVLDTRYTLLSFPFAVAVFSLVLTGTVAGVATAALFLGLFVLAGSLVLARGAAHLDRVQLSSLYRREVTRRPYRGAAADDGAVRRLLAPLRCPQSWLDLLHALVRFPVSLVAFVLTVVWWTVAAAGLLYPLWGWSLYIVPGYTDVGSYLHPQSPEVATLVVYMVGGLLCALTLAPVVGLCARACSGLARVLLLVPEEQNVRVRTAGPERPLSTKSHATI